MRPSHLEWPLFRWTRFFLGGCAAFTLFVSFIYLVGTRDFSSAGSVLLAVLATYIAFASLLYSRAAALCSGPSKVRAMYSAERTMQAVTFTLVGALLGVVFFACGHYIEAAAHVDSAKPHPWLLIFFFPLMLVMWGYAAFLTALRVVSREFFHPIPVRDIVRRIKAKR